jgi:uncharacterized protein (DUF4415 family)
MESEGNKMRDEYDFSNAKKNPYAKLLKKQVTINLDEDVVTFFKKQSDNVGIPYQTLINLYLRDCMVNERQLEMSWK